MRRIYGLLEAQFAGYYVQASGLPGRTGEEIVEELWRRYFAPTEPGERGPSEPDPKA